MRTTRPVPRHRVMPNLGAHIAARAAARDYITAIDDQDIGDDITAQQIALTALAHNYSVSEALVRHYVGTMLIGDNIAR